MPITQYPNLLAPDLVPLQNEKNLLFAELITGSSMQVITGTNKNIGIGVEEDLWDLGGDINFITSPLTLYVSSTDATDIGIPVVVDGLDDNLEAQRGFGFLNGQNQAAVIAAKQWMAVNRIINFSPSPSKGDVYLAESGSTTNGVPDNKLEIYALALQESQTSLTGAYSVPIDKVLAYNLIVTAPSKGRDTVVEISGKPAGGTFITGPRILLYESNSTFDITSMAGTAGPGVFKTSAITNDNEADISITIIAKLFDKQIFGL